MKDTQKNRVIKLKSRPFSVPDRSNFSDELIDLQELRENQVLLRTLFLSLDPYMRGRMDDAPSYAPPVPIGAPVSRIAAGGKRLLHTVIRKEPADSRNSQSFRQDFWRYQQPAEAEEVDQTGWQKDMGDLGIAVYDLLQKTIVKQVIQTERVRAHSIVVERHLVRRNRKGVLGDRHSCC